MRLLLHESIMVKLVSTFPAYEMLHTQLGVVTWHHWRWVDGWDGVNGGGVSPHPQGTLKGRVIFWYVGEVDWHFRVVVEVVPVVTVVVGTAPTLVVLIVVVAGVARCGLLAVAGNLNLSWNHRTPQSCQK